MRRISLPTHSSVINEKKDCCSAKASMKRRADLMNISSTADRRGMWLKIDRCQLFIDH
jgi:hypothetical protein